MRKGQAQTLAKKDEERGVRLRPSKVANKEHCSSKNTCLESSGSKMKKAPQAALFV
jgi:hypothetical protein